VPNSPYTVPFQRDILPRRAVAYDTDGRHLQGLQVLRRHEDEATTERDARLVLDVHEEREQLAEQAASGKIRQ